jgi:UDP-glucuronate decarboxylase
MQNQFNCILIKNKKILVAGGNGFIGTNICEKLYKDNKITIIDSEYSSTNKRDFWKSKNVEYIHESIQNYEFPKFCEYDIIINLACIASPPLYQKEPLYTMDTCYNGTKRLLEFMRKDTIFLQASTSEVYGESLNEIQYESDRGNVNCYGPRSCYDEGKRIAETLCYEWAKKGYNTKIVRIFNTYGPHMSLQDGRIIPNLISQALQNKPLTIYGDGYQTRSFQYIDDLIDGMISLILSNINSPINIGNPEEITINELVDIIKHELNLPEEYPIEYKCLPVDDPTHRKPGIIKAQTLLNYQPKIKIQQGIQNTIQWIKNTIT